MYGLERNETPQVASSRADTFLTRPLPHWFSVTTFLWTAASLLALVFGFYLLLARPVQVATWDADHLTTTVPEKNDYRIYRTETDGAGQRFAWVQPDNALFIVPVNTNNARPVKVTIRARGASAAGGPANTTTVLANGTKVGEIKPVAGQSAFQDFTFNITAPYNDAHRINLNFSTPAWQPAGDPRVLGFMLQSVTVDAGEVWSPLFRPGRAWLIWLLPLLAGLAIAVKLVQLFVLRRGGAAAIAGYLTAGITLAASGFMALWFFLLARIGYSGLLNQDLFWLYAATSAYLAGFFLWLAVAGWGWGPPGEVSLFGRVVARSERWRVAHPVMAALAAIFGFNLFLSGVFVGKIALESGGINPVFRYLDGPEYVFIAHGFYDTQEPLLRISDFGAHSPFYWTAHFPGFPLLLMLVHPVVGWLWSPLAVNFLASTAFAGVFYLLVRDFGYALHPVWLSFAALVLPVRWLIYHNVGGSEPVFMFFQVLSLYLFKKERYCWAGLAGAGAIFTRPPGIFLWAGFMLFLVFEAAVTTWNGYGFSIPKLFALFNWRAFAALLLIPLGLVAVFGLYAWRYGDLLAYFKVTENVTHVEIIPFPSVMSGAPEAPALIFTYVLGSLGLIALWRQRRFDLFWVGMAAFFYTLFLLHNDVLRYSIPFFAIVVLVPFAGYFSGKVARWLAVPVVVALFFYSWGAFNSNLLDPTSFDMMKNILQIK